MRMGDAVAVGTASREADQQLAESFLAGDETAFRKLYRRHTPRLLLFLARFLGGSESDAEDAVQETWLKVAERLGAFRWEASFGSWLTAIGLNVAREMLRKRGRRSEEPIELASPDHAAPPEPSVVDTVDLERAIRSLADGYRTVLLLHDVEGYRHEEIATQLGISVGTSKSQLFHARRAMRVALGGARKERK